VNYPTHFELPDKQAEREFHQGSPAALVNSATLQTELNKQLVRIALPNDDLIEKINKELNSVKSVAKRYRQDSITAKGS
jgi:hypothetical protein